MAKSSPAVSNTPAAGDSAAAVKMFRDVTHAGHPLTHVGSFVDSVIGNPPYDVWYCRTDHAIFIG